MDAQHLLDLEADGKARIEARHRLLEDHGNILADDLAAIGIGKPEQIDAVEQQFVGRHLRRPGQEAHGSQHGDGLAGSALADDRQHFAGVDLERNAVDSPERTG